MSGSHVNREVRKFAAEGPQASGDPRKAQERGVAVTSEERTGVRPSESLSCPLRAPAQLAAGSLTSGEREAGSLLTE